MSANLIITDSYFNLFPLLTKELTGKANDLSQKNFVFCEEKLTLMAERAIAAAFKGSFNTEVYSFGNYLRKRKSVDGLLSKEGSAIVVKKILSETPLTCLNRGKVNVAPALFELISQLKSAKVSAEDLSRAAREISGAGVLSAKLNDIAAAYSAYDQYIKSHGFSDQSSVLDALPDIILNDDEIKGANVFIVGFSGFTAQIKRVISAILNRADNCTAILTGGENKFVFVNEAAGVFKSLCAENGIICAEKTVASDYSDGGKIIKDGLFNPSYARSAHIPAVKPRARFLAARNITAETERIAETIKSKVMSGECRYRDFTAIVPDGDEYKEFIGKSFSRLSVPAFIDVKKNPQNFPLPALITAYADLFFRGWKIPRLAAFFKNPYIPFDRAIKDKFENYIYKYDLAYNKFKKAFTMPAESDEELARFNEFREYVCNLIEKFDVPALLSALSVDKRTEELSAVLKTAGENEDAEINGQVLKKVKEVIAEIKLILPSAALDAFEFKNLFISGMAAMEISIIPQYNDAVFVGNFKQAALYKAKYLFVAGLTSAVPTFCEDVALLTDGDLDALAGIKVLVEPKINVVNHRLREETALGLAAFDKEVYFSYPLSDCSGGQNEKSEIIYFAESYFTKASFPRYDGYVTKTQGLRSFARDCRLFATLKIEDFSLPAAFYQSDKEEAERIVRHADKEVKTCLENKRGVLTGGIVSPTAIEDYYTCPYRSFLTHTLNVKERETGKVNAISVGNLMHEIFKDFIERVQEVTDDKQANDLFDEVSGAVLKKDDYARFDDGENAFSMQLALNECRKYCVKMSQFYLKSSFKPRKRGLEVRFGDGEEKRGGYPAVNLLGGRIKLGGTIDRIDECGDFCRVIDYKTGGNKVSANDIYAGVKLQLYLYALAVTDKTLAGAYYLRVRDEYEQEDNKNRALLEGKTAVDTEFFGKDGEEFIPSNGNDKPTVETLIGVKEYARKMAEQAAEQLDEGVIIPSPIKDSCEYCQFSSLCHDKFPERKVVYKNIKYVADSAKDADKNGN